MLNLSRCADEANVQIEEPHLENQKGRLGIQGGFFLGEGGGREACHIAFGILVLQPEIKPRPSAVKPLSLNHWTAREFSKMEF